MSSEKKKRKLKNSYCVPSTLKNKLPHKCKRLLFYTSSQRQKEKQEVKENEETVPPETIYNEKLEVVEKAEKDLHKFLIDYPQFKE